MARKKTAGAEEAPPEEPKQDAGQTPTPAPSDSPPNGNGQNGEKRKPTVSYRLMSDRTTSIEAAVWSNEMQNGDGEKWTQHSVTLSRSYKDQNGQWCKGGSYRIHDLPIVLFLLQKCHAFALTLRTEDSTMPF